MILVDECRWPFQGRLWCHLVSNTSYDELHSFAQSLGLPRVAFQGDHYDLHEDSRLLAIRLGATPVDSRHLVRTLTSSGLRRGPALTRGGLAAVSHLDTPILTTERLVLRQWLPKDFAGAARLNSDPAVMEFLGGPASANTVKAMIDTNSVSLAVRGYGLWAIEHRKTNEFVGIVGLVGTNDLPVRPAIAITVRIGPTHSLMGFATEAVSAALRYGFEQLDLAHIFASTPATNTAAVKLLNRLNFVGVDEFDHPLPPADDPYRRHLLFRWSSDVTPV